MIAESLGIEVSLEGRQKLKTDWADTVNEFRGGSKVITDATQGTSRAARELQASTLRATAGIRSSATAARDAQGRFTSTGSAARGLKGELEGVAGAGSRVGEVFRGALGAQVVAGAFQRASSAALDFVRGSVDSVLQGQRIGRSFRFAAGGAAEGAQEFAFVKAESERLGLQLNVTASAYAKLTAASKGTELQGKGTREIFTGVTEAATVLGLASYDTEGALNAIQQMMSKGTVQAEELRGQLGERIPGAFQMAARAMGVTTQQLGKMLEAGEVISADFLPKFARELHKTFGKDAVTAANEGQAGINRFKTSLFELSASFGSGFMVGVTQTMNHLRQLFQDEAFRDKVKEMGQTFGNALSGLVENFGAVVTAGKAFFAMFAVQKLAAIVTGIRGMGIALAGVVAANPILAALTLTVGAATVAWDQAKKASRSWHDEIKEGEAALKRYNPELDNLENRVKKLHAAAMAADPFANIAPDAGNASNRDKLSDDQKKTLLKLQKEIAQIRAETVKEGEDSFDRERAVENANFKLRVEELGKFGKAVELEKERHRLALVAIQGKEQAEINEGAERANKARRAKVLEDQKAELAVRQNAKERAKTAQEELQKVQEALAADGFARQRLQSEAHFKEMEEAITKYARTTSEKEELLTRLHKQQSDVRKRIDREEVAARIESAGMLASNLIQAWQNLYSNAKKNALLHKSLAVGEIIINTALAVTKALAQGGIFGIPMAISIGALGAAQIYKASQQKFAQGGIVQGPYTSGDRIPVRANAGEMILTQAQQAQLFAMANGGGGRQGGGNTYEINYRPTYQISGSMTSMAVQQLISIIERDKAGFGRYWKNEIVAKGFA